MRQLALFGVQSVHLGHASRRTGVPVCLFCKVSLVMAAEWLECDCCPGWVESAAAGSMLPDAVEPASVTPELERAA